MARNPRFWIAIALVSLLLLLSFGPIQGLLDQRFLLDQLHELGPAAVILFILAHILAAALGVPGTVLAVVGGICYGLVWGSLWTLMGTTLGAMVAFWLARYLLHGWAERRLGQHRLLVRFNRAIAHNPLVFVLMVRLVPISPFSLVNFLFGLTRIHWRPYSLGTFLGLIPGVVVYTWLGVAGDQAVHGGSLVPLFMACSLLVVLSLVPLFLRRQQRY